MIAMWEWRREIATRPRQLLAPDVKVFADPECRVPLTERHIGSNGQLARTLDSGPGCVLVAVPHAESSEMEPFVGFVASEEEGG